MQQAYWKYGYFDFYDKYKPSMIIGYILLYAGVGALLGDYFIGILILMLFWAHEKGHELAFKNYGSKVRGIYIMPTFSVATLAEDIKNPDHRFKMLMAGPAMGIIFWFIISTLYLLAGRSSDMHDSLRVVMLFTGMTNLYNLAPLSQTDGDHALPLLYASLKRKTVISVYVMWLIIFILALIGLRIEIEDYRLRMLNYLIFLYFLGTLNKKWLGYKNIENNKIQPTEKNEIINDEIISNEKASKLIINYLTLTFSSIFQIAFTIFYN